MQMLNCSKTPPWHAVERASCDASAAKTLLYVSHGVEHTSGIASTGKGARVRSVGVAAATVCQQEHEGGAKRRRIAVDSEHARVVRYVPADRTLKRVAASMVSVEMGAMFGSRKLNSACFARRSSLLRAEPQSPASRPVALVAWVHRRSNAQKKSWVTGTRRTGRDRNCSAIGPSKSGNVVGAAKPHSTQMASGASEGLH